MATEQPDSDTSSPADSATVVDADESTTETSSEQTRQTDEWYAQTEKDRWQTPRSLYEGIDSRCGGIDLDPCAGPDTTIGTTNWHIGRGEDGLERDWFGTVFVNPPFSAKREWITKVIDESQSDETDTIFLVTPDSTDVQSWWHGKIVPAASWMWFSEGRIGYVDPDEQEQKTSPTFGTVVSVYGDPISQELRDWFRETGWLVDNRE